MSVEIEVLHNLHGDKRKKFDNSTEEGRKEIADFFTKQTKLGTAIFLERGKKTYKIKSYDPKKDAFIVASDKGKDVPAKAGKGTKTAVAPVAGGVDVDSALPESRFPHEDTVPITIDTEFLRSRGFTAQRAQKVLDDLATAQIIGDLVAQMVQYIADGGSITQKEMEHLISDVAEDIGCISGVPMPSTHDLERGLVLAPSCAMGLTNMANPRRPPSLQDRAINVWHSYREDCEVLVVPTADAGNHAVKLPLAGERMRKLVRTSVVRSGTMQTAEAEFKALDSLKTRVTDSQYKSYVLNNCFIEHSKRSHLWYIFRKGYPTLAMSYNGNDEGKCLAALCLHPMGYYEGTFCGVMTPTDEVIAHLVMMRSDERKYWAKSGQWHPSDVRSGL